MALGLLNIFKIKDHKKLTTREFRENLAEALTFTSRDAGRIVLQKSGEDRVAVVSLTDLWILDALDDLNIKKDLGPVPDLNVFMDTLAERLNNRILESERNKGSPTGGSSDGEATKRPD